MPGAKAWKMFAGYRINRFFGLRGSFIDFDKYSLTATSGAESTTVSAQGHRLRAAAVGFIHWAARGVRQSGISKVKAQSREASLSGPLSSLAGTTTRRTSG